MAATHNKAAVTLLKEMNLRAISSYKSQTVLQACVDCLDVYAVI
jgi:hypothetical protein